MMCRQRPRPNRNDLDVVKRQILALDPSLAGEEDCDTFKTAVVVMSAGLFGCRIKSLCRFTRYPRKFIMPIERNMRRAGLWDDGQVDSSWFVEPGDGTLEMRRVSFWTHVLVAEGELVAFRREDGQQAFRHRAYDSNEPATPSGLNDLPKRHYRSGG
jgi:hypothetical protein